jgi:hypothetical protein
LQLVKKTEKMSLQPGKISFALLIVIALILIAAPLLYAFRTETRMSYGSSEVFEGNQTYRIPDSVSFAGENLPLENFDTRESLEREVITTAYRHSSTILIIKKASRYFPLIEKILAENGVPDDFKYLAVAESDLSNAVSPAGATGFWQIMSETGKEAGLEINQEIDERYHIEKSTEFACKYLLESYERYGSWTLAAASYNGGRRAIDEQIEIQHENNYYDLLLTEETARYIFRVVAYKLIISKPEAFGFDMTDDDYYKPVSYEEVKVDSAITSFSAFARNFGTNYKMLKFLNPWLRKPFMSNRSARTYYIKIPSQGSRKINFRDSSY